MLDGSGPPVIAGCAVGLGVLGDLGPCPGTPIKAGFFRGEYMEKPVLVFYCATHGDVSDAHPITDDEQAVLEQRRGTER